MIELAAALRAVLAALDDSAVEYLVVGSTAAAAWGVARSTRDVDLVTILGQRDLNTMLSHLDESDLYVPLVQARQAVQDSGSFNVLHPSSGGKVDIFVAAADDEFTRSRLLRRVRAEVLGASTWIATAEDVVLAKLRWRLESRSEVQWRDCVEIAAANDLDQAYLDNWGATLGVSTDLADLLKEVDQAKQRD